MSPPRRLHSYDYSYECSHRVRPCDEPNPSPTSITTRPRAAMCRRRNAYLSGRHGVVPSFGVERSAAPRSCPSARPGEGRVTCARDRPGCEHAGPLWLCAARDPCWWVEGTSGKPSGAEPLGCPPEAASEVRGAGHVCPVLSHSTRRSQAMPSPKNEGRSRTHDFVLIS